MSKTNFGFNLAFEWLIVILHFTLFHDVAIVIGFFYTLYLVGFKRKLDLLAIFIVLLPAICFRAFEIDKNDLDANLSHTNFLLEALISNFSNTFFLGSIAVSTKLAAVVGVPIRLLRTINVQMNPILLGIWFICLGISLLGLFQAVNMGIVNSGGITVGVRAVLAVGALLIPLNTTEIELKKHLYGILRISLFLVVFGLINEHWIFIVAALAVVAVLSNISWIIKGFALVWIFTVLVTGGYTFTILLTILMSLAFLISWNLPNSKLKNSTGFMFFVLTFPVLVVFFILGDTSASLDGILGSERFIIKLYDDRGILWRHSLLFIGTSDFFIVPAGRAIPVYYYASYGNILWEPGAHNIYLELGRQLGGFSMLLIMFIIFRMLLINRPFHIKMSKGFIANVYVGLLVVYMVFGLTGNSLVYDGVGFLFWLMIGQIVKMKLA